MAPTSTGTNISPATKPTLRKSTRVIYSWNTYRINQHSYHAPPRTRSDTPQTAYIYTHTQTFTQSSVHPRTSQKNPTHRHIDRNRNQHWLAHQHHKRLGDNIPCLPGPRQLTSLYFRKIPLVPRLAAFSLRFMREDDGLVRLGEEKDDEKEA